MTDHPARIIYQYPLAGAGDVSPQTDIGIRAESIFDAESFAGSFTAIGSHSGIHRLHGHLSSNGMVAIFHPKAAFLYGETVHVAGAARLSNGERIADTFSFTTTSRAHDWSARPVDPVNIPEASPVGIGPRGSARTIGPRASALSTQLDSVQSFMTVTVDKGATPGQIYFANVGWVTVPGGSFLSVLDEHGKVLRDSDMGISSAMDFKKQPNGMLTYFDNRTAKYYGLDSVWNLVDSFEVAMDYLPDGHELRVFPDGSYALLGAQRDGRDMRQYITGGNADASVESSLIQLFDRDAYMFFQWRGVDHYHILDAVHVNFTAPSIDFQHANSIEFEHPNASTIDSAGDIILSNRHLCEVTKIDAQTGAIKWRFGGANNQFKLIGDSIWFSYQHSVRLLPNGHLVMFDNANYDSLAGHPDTFIRQSRALEYELDTVAMTARLVWQFHHTPETYSDAMGYVERLPNGNTLIGWGDDTLAITEVDKNNETVFEMQTPPGNFSYRVVKYPTPQSAVSIVQPIQPNSLEVFASPDGSMSAHYVLSEPDAISLKLYDILGREVRTISPESRLEPGQHSAAIDLRGLPHGVYWCVLRTMGGSLARTITNVR